MGTCPASGRYSAPSPPWFWMKTSWHDATFWSVREKRDKMAQELPEWEDLREQASQIKKHTITHLADYLEQFSDCLESRGVKVHWAKDAAEFIFVKYVWLFRHEHV